MDGRSLNKIAHAAGVCYESLRRFANEGSTLTLYVAAKLAAALGLELRSVKGKSRGKGKAS